MPVKMLDTLLDENGKPILNPKNVLDDQGGVIRQVEDTANPLTVRQVLYRAISHPQREDQAVGESSRLTLFMASQRIVACDEVEFTVDEAKLILDRVAKTYNIPVWGQIKQHLDPNSMPKLTGE